MIVDNKKAQKRKRGYKKIALNPHFNHLTESYTKWLHTLGYANTTVKTNQQYIIDFLKYLQSITVYSIYQVTQEHLQQYNSLLHESALAKSTIQSIINNLELLSKYLEKTENYKLVCTYLKVEQTVSLERTILTVKEIQSLFTSLENTPKGLLQRAFLHLCYSCGLRIKEVSNVKREHIDYKNKLLKVIPSKNYYGRYIPLNAKVCKDLLEYENYARPLLNPNGQYFLVSSYVNTLSTENLRGVLYRILKNHPFSKHITAHSFRHSIATHLLQQGMDLESIAQFLGHRSLKSTQKYTQIAHETPQT